MRHTAVVVMFGCYLWLAANLHEAQAHCQVPCGIYDDHARIHAMYEDVETIRKAVAQIKQLGTKTDPLSRNQTVRWVLNKEKHAEVIIRTISDYFMTQKIKAPKSSETKAYQAYLNQLAHHHAVMTAAMVAKQTVSTKAVNILKKAVDQIAVYWPGKK